MVAFKELCSSVSSPKTTESVFLQLYAYQDLEIYIIFCALKAVVYTGHKVTSTLTLQVHFTLAALYYVGFSEISSLRVQNN